MVQTLGSLFMITRAGSVLFVSAQVQAGAVRLGAAYLCAIQRVSRRSPFFDFFGYTSNLRSGARGATFMPVTSLWAWVTR